jgi:hypothetical protein
MPQFWLPQHINVCIADDIIWLDRRRNKYERVSGSLSCILSQLVHGWPTEEMLKGMPTQVTPTSSNRDTLAANLVAKGLLTTSVMHGKRYTCATIKAAKRSIDYASDKPIKIHWHHIVRMLIAYAAARLSRLHRALDRVENRRTNSVENEAVDEEKLRRLCLVFRTLQRIIYTRRRRCLLDSLTLEGFLYRYGISVSLVFGVSVSPFCAHIHAQYDDVVLNDDPEFVCQFKTIAVI